MKPAKLTINWPLALILIVAAFFRLYNFKNLQYFGGDEEIITAFVRHIVWDSKPILTIFNASVGFSLGPFYHWLLAIFYKILNFDLVNLQLIGSSLGILTTYAVYLIGKETKNEKLGYIAAFLYSSSFLISLFDRRLFHITPNPLLSTVAMYSLIRIIKGDKKYIPFLALPIGFSFHSDLSLIVLVIAIGLTYLVYRISLQKRYTLYMCFLLLIFLSPLAIAEARHGLGTISGPIIKSLVGTKTSNYQSIPYFTNQTTEILNTLSRVIFSQTSKNVETNFLYSVDYPKPFLSPVPQAATLALLVLALKSLKNTSKKRVEFVPYIVFVAFLIGVSVFGVMFKSIMNQHFYMLVFPAFTLMLAQGLYYFTKGSTFTVIVILFVFLSINFYTLVNSQVSVPLIQKIELVTKSLIIVDYKPFSLYSSGSQKIRDGGWTELFTLQGRPPVKSYWYDGWSWLYSVGGLFLTTLQKEDPENIIVIQESQKELIHEGKLLQKLNHNDLTFYFLLSKK